jgi:RND family efflux transporter MFP subunit
MMRRLSVLLALLLTAWSAAAPAHAAETLTVHPTSVTDEKAVFATVESSNVVPARARVGGTVADLSVHPGDAVRPGQVIADVADEKQLLNIAALNAQIAAVRSQLAQAQTDLTRAEALYRQGAGTRVALDQARTALEVNTATLKARTAERDVATQQLAEGRVLAPVAGRVLSVPVTNGTVVLAGDPLASIAQGNYILRLRVPERQSVTMKDGEPVRVDAAYLGRPGTLSGRITLVYPLIQDGRVVADADVPNLGAFFVGQRILVWISAGERRAFVIPADYIVTRFGLDYVRRREPSGIVVEIPVQRGESRPTAAMPHGLEILSGLRDGDVLVRP